MKSSLKTEEHQYGVLVLSLAQNQLLMDAKALGENFSSSGVLNKKGRELNANDLAEVLNHYWLTVTRGNTKTFKTMCQITISFGEIECQRSVWYGGWEKEHRKIATQCVFYEVLNDNAKIQLQRQ